MLQINNLDRIFKKMFKLINHFSVSFLNLKNTPMQNYMKSFLKVGISFQR